LGRGEKERKVCANCSKLQKREFSAYIVCRQWKRRGKGGKMRRPLTGGARFIDFFFFTGAEGKKNGKKGGGIPVVASFSNFQLTGHQKRRGRLFKRTEKKKEGPSFDDVLPRKIGGGGGGEFSGGGGGERGFFDLVEIKRWKKDVIPHGFPLRGVEIGSTTQRNDDQP